jgi:hypothetical protein
LAVFSAWKSADSGCTSVARTIRCLSSAVIVGGAVVLLSLFVILNTVGC